MRDSLIEGFNEDKAIIEGQQVLLDKDPGFRMRALEADAGLSHFRLLMRKRIKEEKESRRRQAGSACNRLSRSTWARRGP